MLVSLGDGCLGPADMPKSLATCATNMQRSKTIQTFCIDALGNKHAAPCTLAHIVCTVAFCQLVLNAVHKSEYLFCIGTRGIFAKQLGMFNMHEQLSADVSKQEKRLA